MTRTMLAHSQNLGQAAPAAIDCASTAVGSPARRKNPTTLDHPLSLDDGPVVQGNNHLL
jgi:hypothetical protein